MNLPDFKTVTGNLPMLERIESSLLSMQARGELSDVRANKTIFFWLDTFYGIPTGIKNHSADVGIWRLKAFARLQALFSGFYVDQAQISPSRFDGFTDQPEKINPVAVFLSEVGNNASGLVGPNLAALGFSARNLWWVLPVGVVVALVGKEIIIKKVL